MSEEEELRVENRLTRLSIPLDEAMTFLPLVFKLQNKTNLDKTFRNLYYFSKQKGQRSELTLTLPVLVTTPHDRGSQA